MTKGKKALLVLYLISLIKVLNTVLIIVLSSSNEILSTGSIVSVFAFLAYAFDSPLKLLWAILLFVVLLVWLCAAVTSFVGMKHPLAKKISACTLLLANLFDFVSFSFFTASEYKVWGILLSACILLMCAKALWDILREGKRDTLEVRQAKSKTTSSAKRGVAITVSSVALCLVSALMWIGVTVWYDFFDIRGLTMYDGEPIKQIYACEENVYLITEDGSGYVSGYHDSSSHRAYRNAEFYADEALGIAPVLFFDGREDPIVDIIPFRAWYALFITEGHDLYWLYDMQVKKIGESIVQADVKDVQTTKYSQTSAFCMNVGEVDTDIYAVDTEGNVLLIRVTKQAVDTSVIYAGNCRQIAVCADTLYVTTRDGQLCELTKSQTTNAYTLSEPIVSNVQSVDTVHSEEGEAWMINVLLTDGTLYAKGTFDAYDVPTPYVADEWTVLHEEVTDFSLARMGTVMLLQDGSCVYFGLDTDFQSQAKAAYVTLPVDNAQTVYASEGFVCVTSEDCLFTWGHRWALMFNRLYSGNHNVFTGTAYTIEQS